MTLNDLEWLFTLNSVFVPVWLAPTVPLSKNNCAKHIERKRYCVAQRPSVMLSSCHAVCVSAANNLGGEGNALYPVLSS